jgi:hypothetical protein
MKYVVILMMLTMTGCHADVGSGADNRKAVIIWRHPGAEITQEKLSEPSLEFPDPMPDVSTPEEKADQDVEEKSE